MTTVTNRDRTFIFSDCHQPTHEPSNQTTSQSDINLNVCLFSEITLSGCRRSRLPHPILQLDITSGGRKAGWSVPLHHNFRRTKTQLKTASLRVISEEGEDGQTTTAALLYNNPYRPPPPKGYAVYESRCGGQIELFDLSARSQPIWSHQILSSSSPALDRTGLDAHWLTEPQTHAILHSPVRSDNVFKGSRYVRPVESEIRGFSTTWYTYIYI